MKAYPLVSIIVITYNSSKYVLETLESAKTQSYQNIELIISDDCSTDNTGEICRKWVNENKNRFVRTELIVSEINTGISANCNRGLAAAEGEWIKLIAGDDILLDNCLEDNIAYTNSNKEAGIIYSKPKRFGGDESSMQISENNYLKNEWLFTKSSSIQLQNEMERIPYWYTATQFIKRDILMKFKFDESYRNLEDTPLVLKCLKSGIKLFYFPIYTVKYRFGHGDSVQGKISNKISHFDLYRNEYFLYEIKNKGLLVAWNHYLTYFTRTKKNKNYKFLLLFSPYYVVNFFLRLLPEKNKNTI